MWRDCPALVRVGSSILQQKKGKANKSPQDKTKANIGKAFAILLVVGSKHGPMIQSEAFR